MMYEELVKSLRICGDFETDVRFPGKGGCDGCAYHDEANDVCNSWDAENRKENIMLEAADAIEDLENKLNLWRQDKISRWIPVTERFPEETYPVLVAYLGYNDKLPKSDMVAMYDDGDWYWYDDESKCKVIVTHWQPLPEPPKEDA